MFDIKNLSEMKIVLTLTFLSCFCLSYGQKAYKLSDDSKLTVHGSSTIHDWIVHANNVTGFMSIKNGEPELIKLEVVVNAMKSERGAVMDKKIRNALMEEMYPKVTFELVQSKNPILHGKLNIAGNERMVQIPIAIDSFENRIKISGQYTLLLQDYGITPPTAMFGQIVVGEEVMVKFELHFLKTQEEN